ncbi:MAG: hypothetical protein E6Q97_01545 [Desulfurellales bacterium]|nr:MAG: hypothetical protein E6Q97_01545 [Desulfurellales bacterium]
MRVRDIPQASTTFVVGDIHFDLHHRNAWEAFVRCVWETNPDEIVINGDFLDFGMLSRYPQDAGDPLHAIEQIKVFVSELRRITERAGKITVIEGNHDERWYKITSSVPPETLKGAMGLSLREQCLHHGMSPSVNWIREATNLRGYRVGTYLIRHGHKQQGRFGGPMHIAANRLNKNNGQSEIVGHHHRAQLFCRTAGGKTAVAIASPCMAKQMNYALDPDWQLGFVAIESAPKFSTAYPVIMDDDGAFCFRGHIYDGRKLMQRRKR